MSLSQNSVPARCICPRYVNVNERRHFTKSGVLIAEGISLAAGGLVLKWKRWTTWKK
jgi:hypothetical protein